jgi:hypothetical protein
MAELATPIPLSDLYESDETAWLEEMSRLAAARRFVDMDAEHLAEYLSDMARRDKREVLSRLTILLAHLLKWDFQPEARSKSWQATIASQRDELKDLLESRTLRNHALAVLAEAYARAVRLAALETDSEETSFPAECPFTLETMLGSEQ